MRTTTILTSRSQSRIDRNIQIRADIKGIARKWISNESYKMLYQINTKTPESLEITKID